MVKSCVYDCRHPLWGGEGACIIDDDAAVDETCLCDVGFATVDALGNPSCVRKGPVFMAYLAVTIVGLAMISFSAWHVLQDRRLSTLDRGSRRFKLRRRLMISTR